MNKLFGLAYRDRSLLEFQVYIPNLKTNEKTQSHLVSLYVILILNRNQPPGRHYYEKHIQL
jgi:hypothetical protein